MDWQARADELLFDGESVCERVDAEGDRVVVTSHRVLVFTPEGDGANFRAVDRPNVTGVRAGTQGNADRLRRAAVACTGGLGALVLGLLLDFDSLVPNGGVDVAGGAAGIGGLLETIGTLLRIVALLDDLLLAVGLLVLLSALALTGIYWTQREPKLTIAVAGADDLQVTWNAHEDANDRDDAVAHEGVESAAAAADRLRRALST